MGIITASAALWLYNKYSQDNNDGKGIQVGEVKNPYIMTTSGDVNERESDELARQTIGTITKYGLSAGAMYLVKKVLENQKIQRNLRNYTEMSYLAESISGTTDDALNIFGGGRVTLTNLALNTARAFEELSPFSILRTFQTSHILQPFATKEAEFNFESDLLIRQKAYFEELFKTYGTRAFHTDDIINGLRYSKGKIIDAAGDTVIHNTRLVTTEYKGISQGHDVTSNYNRVFRRYISTQENLPHEAKRELFNLSKSIPDDRAPFTIMAAKQGESIETRWIKSAVSQAVSQGFNIVNEPLAFLEEMTGTMINKDNAVFRFVNRYGRINPHASQDTRVADLALGYVRHGSMKLAALAAGYYALDNAAKVFGTEDSGYDKGILEGLATSAVNAKLTYNRLISDRFEEYTEQQEYVAPGSTSLLRLAGFPLAGAMAGGLVSYAMRVTPSAIGGGYKESMRQAVALDDVISPSVSNAAKTTILSDTLTGAARGRRYATRGALLASVFALPFLPGALIGESSDKAEAEYLYGEDVAIKRNRLWFSGSSDIEGEGIKYFTKNWYQRIIAGNKDKILYGDGDTKDELNPFLSPFDYLRNPYRFEEMHKHDMPYPVWGMDISVGGWAGKIFEKSIGAIIKPDIINPALSEMPLESPQIEENAINVGMPSQGDVPQSGSVLWAGGGIHYPVNYSNRESTLIAEGLLSPKRSAAYNPEREAFNYTLNAMYDFAGLKGWMASNLVSGISPFTDNETNQIARSGEATNFAREFMSYNLGGLFGGADILRRIVPMSSEVMYNRVNPLVNQMAPSWLPRGSSYTDFSRGAYWDTVENGYDRLPGQGYEHYNPELKDVSPEDYPDINKFEILSDVAYGSNEYYAINERMTALYQSGEMSEQDMTKFGEIYIQNQERARKRIFHEYKNDEDLEGVSLWGRVLNSVWETTTHNAELPTERLTFFRPAGKLLHQRTAIEDYKKTQLSEGDTALWTHPYKHFIRPFFSDSYRYLDSEHVATHVQERRNVDNYFDALEYYKQMRVYRDSVVSNPYAAEQAKRKAYKTTYGAVASGLDSSEEIQSAYASLSDNERMYFSSFVNARDSDRDDISRIVDGTNTRDMYNMLWARRDALANGDDIAGLIDEENERLIADNIAAYRAYTSSGDQSIGISFREYLQEKRAESLIIEATGIPDEQFAGWDPRIDTKAIKLRALQLSKEDVREYGFWKSDEEELRRNLAVLEEDQVTTQMSSIIRTRARRDFDISHTVKSEMIKRGVETSNIQVSNVGYGDTVINIS